jgi:hypothetical protein
MPRHERVSGTERAVLLLLLACSCSEERPPSYRNPPAILGGHGSDDIPCRGRAVPGGVVTDSNGMVYDVVMVNQRYLGCAAVLMPRGGWQ